MAIIYEKAVQGDLDVGTGAVSITAPGGGSLSSFQIGIHSIAVGQISATATWSPGAITAGSFASTTITLTGAAVGDFVLAEHNKMLTSDLMISAHVSAVNTVKVLIFNPTTASITPASGTLRVLVFASR